MIETQDLTFITNRTEDEQQIILARHFMWEYCVYMDPDFFKAREQILQPIIDALQYLVQWKREKKVSSILINRLKNNKYVEKFRENPEEVGASMPPRAGKSYATSMGLSWALGKYPTECIMRVSYSQRLYNKFSRDVRAFVDSHKFRDVFPGIELSEDNTEIAGWSLKSSKQGAYFGSGVDGTITGFGASLVAVTDDLYKSHSDAISPAISERTDYFMDSAFDARMEKQCLQFDLGTRWTIKDYIGRKIDIGKYDIFIKIPALDENGETFCSDVKTTEQYHKKRDNLIKKGREEVWLSEYMQEPIEVKGLLFRKNEMNRFSMKDLNVKNALGKICFVDTADKGKDFYSAPVAYIFESNKNIYDVFITDVLFSRQPFEFTEPQQVAMILKHKINWTFIETNKEGTLYVNTIKKQVKPFRVKGIRQPSNVSKITRILVEAGYIMDFYFLIDEEQSPEYQAYFENLTDFLKEGDNEHDDAPDSTAGLSKAIRSLFKKLVRLKYKDEQKEEIDDYEEN